MVLEPLESGPHTHSSTSSSVVKLGSGCIRLASKKQRAYIIYLDLNFSVLEKKYFNLLKIINNVFEFLKIHH